jgi:hypothetical protein
MITEEKIEIFSKPLVEQYYLLEEFLNGGGVYVHFVVNRKEDDFLEKIEAALILAKEKGYTIHILPEIFPKQIEFKSKIFSNYIPPEKHPYSNPDFLVNHSEYWDLKCPENSENIVANINKCSIRQNSYAIIMDKHFEIGEKEIMSIKSRCFNEYKKEKLILISNRKVIEIKKEA